MVTDDCWVALIATHTRMVNDLGNLAYFPTALNQRGSVTRDPSKQYTESSVGSTAQRERIEALRQARRAARVGSPSAGIVSRAYPHVLRLPVDVTACRQVS